MSSHPETPHNPAADALQHPPHAPGGIIPGFDGDVMVLIDRIEDAKRLARHWEQDASTQTCMARVRIWIKRATQYVQVNPHDDEVCQRLALVQRRLKGLGIGGGR